MTETGCFGNLLSETEQMCGFVPVTLSLKGMSQCSDHVTLMKRGHKRETDIPKLFPESNTAEHPLLLPTPWIARLSLNWFPNGKSPFKCLHNWFQLQISFNNGKDTGKSLILREKKDQHTPVKLILPMESKSSFRVNSCLDKHITLMYSRVRYMAGEEIIHN